MISQFFWIRVLRSAGSHRRANNPRMDLGVCHFAIHMAKRDPNETTSEASVHVVWTNW